MTPTARPRSSSRAALSRLRATTVISVTPSSARPTRAAGAVPPEPTTIACRRWRWWPSAPATPSMSVLSARQPCSVRTRVLAEPTKFGAFGALVGELQGDELARHRHRHSYPFGAETADDGTATWLSRGIRCGRKSSRSGQARGRPPGAAAVTWNGLPVNPARGFPVRGLLLNGGRIEDTITAGQLDVRQMLLVVLGEQRRTLHVDWSRSTASPRVRAARRQPALSSPGEQIGVAGKPSEA